MKYVNSDYPVGNGLRINGKDFYESDFKDFSTLHNVDENYVPKGFNEIISPNLTVSRSIENKMYKVNVESATDWGAYKLVRYGKCQEGDNINTILTGYVTDGTKQFWRTEIAFYDADLTIIGTSNTNPPIVAKGLSPTSSYYNVVAPAGAVYYAAFASLSQYEEAATGIGYLVYFDARNRTSTFPNVYTKEFDPTSIAAGEVISTTMTIPNAQVGKHNVNINFSLNLQGIRLWADVTDDNTVTVYMQNPTASAIDLEAGVLKAKLLY